MAAGQLHNASASCDHRNHCWYCMCWWLMNGGDDSSGASLPLLRVRDGQPHMWTKRARYNDGSAQRSFLDRTGQFSTFLLALRWRRHDLRITRIQTH
mmetsp:Transcript_9338/g.25382  ORF Transcript_9338/g.25382 Transcript_9338/m.25382 type:complete len:97 (+) Transcript_9338:33-323(+)